MISEIADEICKWKTKGYYNLYLFIDYINYDELLRDSNITYMNYINKEKTITKMFGMTIYITDNVEGFEVYPKEKIPEILLMRMAIDNL